MKKSVIYHVYLVALTGCGVQNDTARPSPLSDNTTALLADEGAISYSLQVKPILDGACVPCHQETPKNGAPDGFRLDVYDDTADKEGVSSMIYRIGSRLKTGTMPPMGSGFGLTRQDRETLLAWIEQGGEGAKQSRETTGHQEAGLRSAESPSPERHPNRTPEVTLLTPNGESVVEPGSRLQITFDAKDPDGDAMTYKLEWSSDSGMLWHPVKIDASRPIRDGAYDWAIPATMAHGIRYRMRVTASDSHGAQGLDMSDRDFAISDLKVTYSGADEPNVRTILQRSCGGSSCHSQHGSQDRLFNADLLSGGAGVKDKINRILFRGNGGGMPPRSSGKPDLEPADIERLTVWKWQGAFEN